MKTARRNRRRGFTLSSEMILVMPIVIGVLMGVVETSMLWLGNHRVVSAAQAGCRVATLPGSNRAAVVLAVQQTLAKSKMAKAAKVRISWARHAGEPVRVEVRVPMRTASPDLMGFMGFGLGNRQLAASCIMRKE